MIRVIVIGAVVVGAIFWNAIEKGDGGIVAAIIVGAVMLFFGPRLVMKAREDRDITTPWGAVLTPGDRRVLHASYLALCSVRGKNDERRTEMVNNLHDSGGLPGFKKGQFGFHELFAHIERHMLEP